MKHEHVVSVGHYPPILVCSLARCTGPHAIACRLLLWRRARPPAKHTRRGMLLPLP
jgi:hypothetical protein